MKLDIGLRKDSQVPNGFAPLASVTSDISPLPPPPPPPPPQLADCWLMMPTGVVRRVRVWDNLLSGVLRDNTGHHAIHAPTPALS